MKNGSLEINRGPYNKATIVFGFSFNNTDHDGSGGRVGFVKVNGSTYRDSIADNWNYGPSSTTISNTTLTSIPVSCWATCDSTSSWCGASIYVKSVVLSM